MARRIWLLRHGEAEPHEVRADFDRRLTPRGEEQSRNAGLALAALGVEPAVILTSPRVRARDTAKLAAEALEGDVVEHDALSERFDAGEALELISGFDGDADLVLVGHEPDFSQVVLDLTGGRVDLKKGGVACIRLELVRGELVVLLRPRELKAIAAGRAPNAPR
jgi:phosphohistidine phosphatase